MGTFGNGRLVLGPVAVGVVTGIYQVATEERKEKEDKALRFSFVVSRYISATTELRSIYGAGDGRVDPRVDLPCSALGRGGDDPEVREEELHLGARIVAKSISSCIK
ncbi:Uncharacterised protein [uncultured archaeon]|nr:Uncharacterised protein [uncultured archaeon]